MSSINLSTTGVRLLLFVSVALPAPVLAQTTRAELSAPAQAAPAPTTASAEPVPERGGARGFIRDVGGDYTHFVSWSTAKWLGAGSLATVAILPADDWIRDATQDDSATLLSETAGQTYGNLSLQVPLAIGWWIAGHATGSTLAADTGRDLVRAQISALSWTYAVKYTVDRQRPNGDVRGFPSGHASAAFATAMVLQEHYGWKLGAPLFAIATYTAASRVVDNKHWASDVVFGAFLGMTSGRTVTIHVRSGSLSVAPLAVAGGGGVTASMRMGP